MNDNSLTILVLRCKPHGLSAQSYTEKLRSHLPEHDVQFARTPAEEHQSIPEADVVTSVNINEELVTKAENLRWFAGVAAGYGHLPLEAMAEQSITVTNASGIHAPNIAEQVLGYLLTFTRRLFKGRERQQQREWRHYQADELQHSTATVVGLGSIGRAIVERLDGFNVSTVGVRYTPSKGGPADEVIGFETREFHKALARSDHLILASPLTDTTRGLISTEELSTLPPHATVCNVGRGPIIDTEALVAAIQNNNIGAAALDVTDPEPLPKNHPLWGFDNVLITPHNAGHSPEHWNRLVEIIEQNVTTLVETGAFNDLENQILP